ncbi:hypothetical protein [Psychroserpens jangbogonensis]|uniref:hypothetical protein n=1 Tax=Psychroserpens jangbogonensis TaxID=1484460 RepID=UPI00053D8E91|nr:hypothetical protein [Psychroserpens jangbogonensis]
MNYNEQLSTPEWKVKREEIISRDNSCCTECGIERNELLGLSSKFGVNDYNQLKAKKFSVGKTDKPSKGIFIIKNNFMNICHFIGKVKQVPDITELNYASQWIEPKNSFEPLKSRYICFDKSTHIKEMYDLNVHHKYYNSGKMAWEYDNEALTTLCASCHKEEHLKNKIPVYNEKGEFQYHAENCAKCSGSGVLSEYNYYMNGICFQCIGTGSINLW